MASNRRGANPAPPAAPPGSARQNEYFVPRDGIDREVIQADICRYLGNDALVRPGSYESDGRVIQGYYITAYRNLTSAMIQDLKADSARWEQERRAASRPAGAAAGAPSRSTDGYRSSEIHHQRQHYGPTPADTASYGDAMAIDPPYSNAPRYPGTGNSGYNGVNSAGGFPPSQRYDPGSFPQGGPYAGHQQSQYSGPPPPDMYTGLPAGSNPMVQTAFGHRTPTQDSAQYVHGAQFRQQDHPVVTTSLSNRAIYQTSGGPMYSSDYAPFPPVGAPPSSAYSHPIDTLYGRGASHPAATTAAPPTPAPSDYLASPAGNQQQHQQHQQQQQQHQQQPPPPQQQQPPAGYSTVPDPKYDESQAPSRSSAPSSSAQAQTPSSSGAPPSRRDRDQERLRDRERNRDQDRDDRHTTDRHSHRHRAR